MELQFQNKPLSCLRSILWAVKSCEQTQEVKLPEAMPDMAKVLGAWGQCLLQSKQWQNGHMGASGGTMVWVLYAPEDGTFPRVVEAWIPWQLHWELPPTQRDGTMVMQPLIKSVDARAVGARKLMVRACVEAAGEALEPVQLETYEPVQVPTDLYLLRRKYPMSIPTEAGEKPVNIEEELQLPPECAEGSKLICYNLQPRIQEEKLVGSRLLFRGNAVLQGLCRGAEEEIHSFTFELPFSQYADLDRNVPEEPAVQVVPAVTNLELDMMDGGKLLVKASVVGQYLVCRRELLEVVEDAYSPGARVDLQVQPLQIPAILETDNQTIQVGAESALQGGTVLDSLCYGSQPEIIRENGGVRIKASGAFQCLYRDLENALQSSSVKWEHSQELPADPGTSLCVWVQAASFRDAVLTGNGMEFRGELTLCRRSMGDNPIPMVTGLEITREETAAERPGLILRRAGSASVWDMAKACGSTEEAIRQANGLTEEPAPGQMLLIPVV